MDKLFGTLFIWLCIAVMVKAGPEFCTRGFKMASRFYDCWEQATFENKYPPLWEPREYLDGKFLEAYATHMCSVVKPQALKCLKKGIKECSNSKKLMEMADKSGGACDGNRLNPFFKTAVTDNLVPVKAESPCFELTDNTYECYRQAGQGVMHMGAQQDNIVTFHRVADKFFAAYWQCMVKIYKSNEKVCPHWQLPMLLTLQKTAMPSLFGLRLRPSQVRNLELGGSGGSSGSSTHKPGPDKLYLQIQLHKEKPELSIAEDSVVLELTDLNEDSPHLEMENEGAAAGSGDMKSLTMKEIKKLWREQKRRNKEIKDFLKKAKDGLVKHQKVEKIKKEKMAADDGNVKSKGSKKSGTKKQLNEDIMIS